MSLDLHLLDNLHESGVNHVARCPACAEDGRDKKGDHLFIAEDGKWGCVVNPRPAGQTHCDRIRELVGGRAARASGEIRGPSKPAKVWPTLDDASSALRKHGLTEKRRDIYHDAGGREHFAIIRYQRADSGKEFRPFHPVRDGWVMRDPPGLLPLFNLPALIERSNEPVYVTEGEKAALLVKWLRVLVTTSAHGAKSAKKSDWSPLAGRTVVILPDNDEDGTAYATTVATILARLDERADVRVVRLPDLPAKGDAEQWLGQFDDHSRDEVRAKLESLVEATPRFVCAAMQDGVGAYAITSSDRQQNSAEDKEDQLIILPGNGVTFNECAEKLFSLIGPTKKIFNRGGAVVELVSKPEFELQVLLPARARSVFERYGKLVVHRSGANKEAVLKYTVCPEETAKALLETDAARQLLPTIHGLLNCAIAIEVDGELKIVGKGFNDFTGLLITGGETPPKVALADAVRDIDALLDEFIFQTEADRSRALASFITPALRFGRHLKGSVPIDVAEADQSQSGKTYRQQLVAALYNEQPSLVTSKTGGVGSVDESFDAQLIKGRPFIQFDNFRGHLDSRHLEAFLTAGNSFPARIPHSRQVDIDPSRFFIQMSSNGVETTRDLANRACIVRILKRTGHDFRKYNEGDLLSHVRARQSYYLGCVFAVIEFWLVKGKPRSTNTRHDFRDWCQVLDWIVQNIFETAPLMDGHVIAQQRVSNPALTFLRKVALEIERSGHLGEEYRAAEIYELTQHAGIEVPGLRPTQHERVGHQMIGRTMAKLFEGNEVVEAEGFVVARVERNEFRDESGSHRVKLYTFRKQG